QKNRWGQGTPIMGNISGKRPRTANAENHDLAELGEPRSGSQPSITGALNVVGIVGALALHFLTALSGGLLVAPLLDLRDRRLPANVLLGSVGKIKTHHLPSSFALQSSWRCHRLRSGGKKGQRRNAQSEHDSGNQGARHDESVARQQAKRQWLSVPRDRG